MLVIGKIKLQLITQYINADFAVSVIAAVNNSIPARIFNGRQYRGIAQFGSASALGAEGRRFESCCPDQYTSYR